MDVLPRLGLGQCRPPEPGQAAPPGQGPLEERLASPRQSQCTADHGTSHHGRVNIILLLLLLLLLLLSSVVINKNITNKLGWSDFLGGFVWFPVDPRSAEHQLLQVNNWSLEEDDEQECEGRGDGEDAEELLCEEHAAEPHRVLLPAVDEIDDGPV